jgi:uncharacterized RDD family membrane protein YckC
MSDHGGGHFGGGHHGGHHGGGPPSGHSGRHRHGTAPTYPVPPGLPPDDYRKQAAGMGPPYYPDWPGWSYAGWGPRAVAFLLDMLAGWGLFALALIIGGISGSVTRNVAAGGAIAAALAGAALTRFVLDRYRRAGRTGQSLGKRVAAIWLVDERTGQPIGATAAFARDLAHLVDGITCYIGYLMPLWDAKRQTFADKIAHTVVVRR